MKRLVWFFAICLAGIAVVMLLIWLGGGFSGYGPDRSIGVAIALGVLCTSLLGVGLMGLMFHSDRSGRDADVGGPSSEDDRNGRRP
jgi:hypothetical protein